VDPADIVARLEVISEDLAELAIGRLRRAINSGAQRDLAERRITQARRSIDKAALILSRLDDGLDQ
jgi:hypothetical protein